jgi:hypothetical protein
MAGTQKAMPRNVRSGQSSGMYLNSNKNTPGYANSYTGKHATQGVVKAPAGLISSGPVRIPPPEQQHTITRQFGQDPAGSVSGQGNTTSALGSGVGP